MMTREKVYAAIDNEGNVGRHTTLRLDSFVDAVAGMRLTYKGLIR